MIKKFWHWFRSPSRMAVGVLITLSFIAGILFWGGFNTALEHTNTEEFCSSCHMNDVVPEYRQSVHYMNRTGVKATCANCHLPHEFIPKWARKIKAATEVYAHLTGKVDTKEKFEAARLEMAEREWARMKANNSQECRNCHNFEAMDFTQQKTVAEKMHAMAIKEGKTCIDCHKGIAHHLPNMKDVRSGFLPEKAEGSKEH
ncbi:MULTISPECIES: NapC/NirT family cytochrome c [unclassified Avibacterium]|uniref:NapC/NirT family cytochrome c n=1 Tax=unclassified Avibacterium TaxID=2685287 RepID=UPI0020270853|nr:MULTISPECIES: NapC/NirT family cytochrome c [unclassified Avibacterium]URL03134.1 NapC/NirT family cytochrome c [Avibacterium sp. 20-126]MCW9717562.1 NapC/NirT family cytochrome c [Avibacterium sp. 21-599]MCW9733120.1 NapC/NirT family cytochrome c [Avibacterium sp. 20-15]URL05465.1 NapC/NirT family cytochrome c [Avibacterium sp. 20-132]URL07565.1 NapC/NirT family cytochrome c [Avibacterium sp. 21-595]